MKLFVMIILYVAFNVYLAIKFNKYLIRTDIPYLNSKPFKIISFSVIGICASSTLFGFFMKISPIQRLIQKFSNYYIGVIFYTIIILIIFDLLRLLFCVIFKNKKKLLDDKRVIHGVGAFEIFLIVFVSFYGFLHYMNIHINRYDVKIEKVNNVTDNLKIALVGDLHLGYSVGYRMVEDMVYMINKEDVDIILIAGDIFDNCFDSVDDIYRVKLALNNLNSKYSVYAVFGNHDVDERLFAGFSVNKVSDDFRDARIDKFLDDCNIKVLNDSSLEVAGVTLIGREDFEKSGSGDSKRVELNTLMKDVNDSSIVFVLEHEPRFLTDISKENVDLHLAGHTHAGQIFPLNLFNKMIWDNSWGMKKYNNMTSFVTSGLGVYGPSMRVFTDSEIMIINVEFKKEVTS